MPTGALFLSSTRGSMAHCPLQKALQFHSFIYLLHRQVTKFWFLWPGVGGVSCWASTAAGRPCQPPPPAEPAGGRRQLQLGLRWLPWEGGPSPCIPHHQCFLASHPNPVFARDCRHFIAKWDSSWLVCSAQVCSCASCGMCRIGAFF